MDNSSPDQGPPAREDTEDPQLSAAPVPSAHSAVSESSEERRRGTHRHSRTSHRARPSHAEVSPSASCPSNSPPLGHLSETSALVQSFLSDDKGRRKEDDHTVDFLLECHLKTETNRRATIENDSYVAFSDMREEFTRQWSRLSAAASAASRQVRRRGVPAPNGGGGGGDTPQPPTAPVSSTTRSIEEAALRRNLCEEEEEEGEGEGEGEERKEKRRNKEKQEKKATAPPAYLVDESTGLLSGRSARRVCEPFIAYAAELSPLRMEPNVYTDRAAMDSAPFDSAPFGSAPFGSAPFDSAPFGSARLFALWALSALLLTVAMLQCGPLAVGSFHLLDGVAMSAAQRRAMGFAVGSVDALGFAAAVVIAALIAPRVFAQAPHAACIIGSLGITASALCVLRSEGTESLRLVVATQLLHGVSLALLMAALFVFFCAAFGIDMAATALLFVSAPAFIAAGACVSAVLCIDASAGRFVLFATWTAPFLSLGLWAVLPPAACEPAGQALRQHMDAMGFLSTARRVEWTFALRGAACAVLVALQMLQTSRSPPESSSSSSSSSSTAALFFSALAAMALGLVPAMGPVVRAAQCGPMAFASTVAIAVGESPTVVTVAAVLCGTAAAVAAAGPMRSIAAMRGDVSGVPVLILVLQCAVGAVLGLGGGAAVMSVPLKGPVQGDAGIAAAQQFVMNLVCLGMGSIAALFQVAAALAHYCFRTT